VARLWSGWRTDLSSAEGMLITERIIAALSGDVEWRVVDVGVVKHLEGAIFTDETRDELAARIDRGDSLGTQAAACVARKYAVEQEAPTRAAVLQAIAARSATDDAHQR
jgi:hypothetical protein